MISRDRGASLFSPLEVIIHLIKIACERPDRIGRSLSQWDCSELARELQRCGIVNSISAETIRRILNSQKLKPWRYHLWLNSNTPRNEEFCRKVDKKDNDKNDPPIIPPRGRVKYNKKTGEPEAKAQRNFTDPESRIMKNADKAFVQAYNAQVVVDSKEQIIMAADVTNQAADSQHIPLMMEKTKENIGRYPKELSADTGYFSEINLKWLKEKTDDYIPGEKKRHNQIPEPAPKGRIPVDLPLPDLMRRKLRTKVGQAKYALRKQIVEPVFGQIKEARGFRRFLLRGLDLVRGEWILLCLTHNILKLFGNKKKVILSNS